MEELYQAHGVTFRYPSIWEVSEQARPDELTITVSSPETAFWSVTLLYERPAALSVVQAALEAFDEEYDQLDIYTVKETLCERPTVARDVEFFCLELLNSAWLRAFTTNGATVLVLYQATDLELDRVGDIFDAISQSLTIEEPDDEKPPFSEWLEDDED